MYVTSTEQRGGILVAVISGGRPELRRRQTAKLLDDLPDFGCTGPVWVVSDVDAPGYEDDGNEIAVYPRAWALEYAAEHWMQPGTPDPDAFLGAFPGREWACREAERRGCWAVLQVDDNIDWLCFLRGTAASKRWAQENGGLALFTDLMAAVALSTNARTVGAQLDAVNPPLADARRIARPGFPYSLFLERVGEGREEWFGPFEDDITHCFQYGTRADGATSAVMPLLHYKKESKSKTGMRAHYDATRAVQLQRLFPQAADIAVRATRSNGRGGARVFHQMKAGAMRNPLIVRDPEMYRAVGEKLSDLAAGWYAGEAEANVEKAYARGVQSTRIATGRPAE